MNIKELKIGVLGGGVSPEREVSLRSATMVYSSLRRMGFQTSFIDIFTTHQATIKKELIESKINLAFLALHGAFGEDGGIQGILEELEILYAGSKVEGSRLAMNKALAKKIFNRSGIPTPGFFCWSDKKNLPVEVKYPLVVKPVSSGSSFGVSLVKKPAQFKPAVDLAFSYEDKILIEDYIEGREFTVGVLGRQALAVVEIIPRQVYFDFKAKYTRGMSRFIAPAEISGKLSREIRAYALSCHQNLGLRGFSRIDFILDKKNQPYVLEANAIPGLTACSLLPLSAGACGIDFDRLILKIMEDSLWQEEDDAGRGLSGRRALRLIPKSSG